MNPTQERLGPDTAARLAAHQAGWTAGKPVLIRHFANAVYLLADEQVVVRVGRGDHTAERARLAVALTADLRRQGLGVTTPANPPSGTAQPVLIDDPDSDEPFVATFWHYYPQPANRPTTWVRDLAHIAGELHTLSAPNHLALSTYRPLSTLRATLADPRSSGHLAGPDREWLLRRSSELLEEYDRLRFPLGTGLIHADFYAGNLLWHRGEVLLGDWDSAATGPREIDLLPTYAAQRFGLPTAVVDEFAAEYGHDLRDWTGYPTLRAIRELSTLPALIRLAPQKPDSATELQHRLHTLRTEQSDSLWTTQ